MNDKAHIVTEGEIDFCLSALNCNAGAPHKAALEAQIANSAKFMGMRVTTEVILREGIRAALESDPEARFDEIPDLADAIKNSLVKIGYNGVSHSEQAGTQPRKGWAKG